MSLWSSLPWYELSLYRWGPLIFVFPTTPQVWEVVQLTLFLSSGSPSGYLQRMSGSCLVAIQCWSPIYRWLPVSLMSPRHRASPIQILHKNLTSVNYNRPLFQLKAHYATSGISSLFSWFRHAHFSTQRPLQLCSRYFTTLVTTRWRPFPMHFYVSHVHFFSKKPANAWSHVRSRCS